MPDTLTDVLWTRILDALADRVPGTALESWLRPCRLLEPDGDRLRVAAPNSYTRDWILQNHLPALEHAAAEVIGGRPQLSIEVDGNLPRSSSPLAAHESAVLASGLSSRYTFHSFVAGNSN